ncbi:2-octaprenyl-3-methyl-6-methoxy-1,4-benzoquinol hydroxylase [Edwardsiella hoshinae]|uniref:2-octaprenyl-3-methyl-6-methoxy-1,4-benzoquinol hydroxylase n=1 Tax=Edwardsiella hoshinae TaxID=93378 RepID=A0A376DAB8_9GAMM|nr:3-demethoxyubiquinol 3-hydroxylase [Edwardsiella hoshinae]AOV96221.1 2-octaprenyl-3-methyl-6-methoxy-1,4-benzoquinol hydroxylase [Edwardsiella hoshinae]QPR27897.1 2-octaprenyl-3-methyl-6-methoxy-1,4-benzoquinol hydroxylase [Edwardsiella hoshinae]STC85651.1 2-octaprenyl-3-methyl-6-methoxy-1,4-benzoquinol hydroxylase [Edwardsiella hoshinae]
MGEQADNIVVVGAGMVGAAAALGLAQAGLAVTVVEPQPPAPFIPASAPDLRISAISMASVRLLARLGVWEAVCALRAVPYRGLETWEWQDARVAFRAESLGLPYLGYMLENRVLQWALWQALAADERVTLRTGAGLRQLRRDGAGWQLQLDDGARLHAGLVIAADGAESRVRSQAGIGIQGWQYRQDCMLISVKTPPTPQDVTWQQFTPEGPRAFLPLWPGWASLVWYDSPARIRQLLALPLPQLDAAIRATFPSRLGSVQAVAAGAFPLIRRHARHYVLPGLALLGDAAHTINPLAGQGVNLGYRDVEALLATLLTARARGEAWQSLAVLQRYQRRRRPDNLLMQSGMDLFYAAFSNRLPPLVLLRNLGLMAAEHAGELKTRALRYAIGL